MDCYFLDPSSLNPPIWHCLTQLGKISYKDLRTTRSVPNPQVLAPMDMNLDSKNPINQLTTKEVRDIMCPPASAILHHQITYMHMVIHLYANVGQPTT